MRTRPSWGGARRGRQAAGLHRLSRDGGRGRSPTSWSRSVSDSRMAETAHYLLDQGVAFMMEKPMGLNATEVAGIAEKAAARKAFVALPLPQRYSPFTIRARRMLAEGRFGPLSHLYFRLNRPTSARYPKSDAPWMLDPALAGGGCLRPRLASARSLPAADWRGRNGHRGAAGRAASASAWKTSPRSSCDDQRRAGVRSRSATRCRTTAATATQDRRTRRHPRLAARRHAARHHLRGEEIASVPPPAPLYQTLVHDILDHFRRGAAPAHQRARLPARGASHRSGYELARRTPA